jgi:probable phosphoglycerate mutase
VTVTTLILWRHGHTEWNSEQRIQGHTDVALTALGHAQAAQAAPLLAARSPDAIVASDLVRASDTAAPLAELTGLPVRHDPRLRERFYGDWEGLTAVEIAERFPEGAARKRAGRHDLGHGIEAPTDVMKRVGEGLRDIAETVNPGGTTVVATHSGSARYGMFDLLGWPMELLGTVVALANCHYTELRLDPVRGWTLHGHNLGVAGGDEGYE